MADSVKRDGDVFYDYKRSGWAWKSCGVMSKVVYDYAWQAAAALRECQTDKAPLFTAYDIAKEHLEGRLIVALLLSLCVVTGAHAQCECPGGSNQGCMGGALVMVDQAGTPIGFAPQSPGTELELRILGILPDCSGGGTGCIPLTGGWSHAMLPDGTLVVASLDAGLVCPGDVSVIGQVPYTVDAADINPQFGAIVLLGGWGPTSWFPDALSPAQVGFPGPSGSAFGGGVPVNVATPLAGSGGTCVGDVDGSAVVDVSDLILVIEHWGEPGTRLDCQALGSGPSRGTLDVEDLLAVIVAWGECK